MRKPACSPIRAWLRKETRPRQLLRGLLCALRTTRYLPSLCKQYRNTRPLRDRLIAAAVAQSSRRFEADREAAQDAWETLTALSATVTDTELGELDVQTLLHNCFTNTPVLQPPKSVCNFPVSVMNGGCTDDAGQKPNMLLEQGEIKSTASFVDTAMPMMRCRGSFNRTDRRVSAGKKGKPLH